MMAQGQGRAAQEAPSTLPTDAQIEANRAGIVANLVNQWSGVIAGDERATAGITNILNTASPQKLVAMSQATTFEQFMNIGAGLSPNAFGSLSADLVFNPLTPCRVMDTRFGTGVYAGPHQSPQTVSFYVADNLNANGHVQGGLGACGFPFGSGAAAALNITVVPLSGSGDLKIYPFGATEPNSSIINYYSGTNLANAADVAISPSNLTNDITIKVEFSGPVYIIVDIVGYFAAPNATALEIVRLSSQSASIANGATFFIDSPNCSTRYSLTGGGFDTNPSTTGIWIWTDRPTINTVVNFWRVAGQNNSGAATTVSSYVICARVPGR